MNVDRNIASLKQSNTPDAASAAEERPRSMGERLFDYITYGGFGFGLNLGLSVFITDYFTHGKGENVLRWLTQKSTSAIHSVSGIHPRKIDGTAYGFWKMNLLMSGGHIVMIPIKLMEDSKRHMVHRLNLLLGIDQPILKDGKRVAVSSLSEDELPHLSEDQPKQSWFRTAYRRVLGISATMALGTMMGKQRQHDVENFLTDKLILPSIRTIPMRSVQNLTENDRFQRYTRLVSLDQFFTAITSAIAYMTNGAKKHEGGDLPAMETSADVLKNSLAENNAPNVLDYRKPANRRREAPFHASVAAERVIANVNPQLSVGAS